ncbi:MAG: tetratricopeptide repeat protein [Crocinitomicaceae bacterium]
MHKRFFVHIPPFLLMGVILLVTNCSTEKDALINVGYHNMTARYNGYFNARILMDESLTNYREGVAEDYNEILPLELYPSKEDVPTIKEKYETAQEKCEKVILRHSMPNTQNSKNKSVEHCRWIDDNWFLIGKIHYTTRNYLKAEEVFKFIQETQLYKDQERVHEARIWLAKTYIVLKKYPEAKRVLSQVETDMQGSQSAEKEKREKLTKYEKKLRKRQKELDKKKGVKKPAPFPEDLEDDYEIAMAEFYIAQKLYKKAVPHLEKGIQLTKDRKKRARYMFVLAQILQKIGSGEQAAFYFDKVVKSNAPYEMRFQAQINKALSLPSGGQEIRNELAKLLKDEKNLEYLDQIYYALAELEMKDGNKEQAIVYYTQSAFYSIKNDRQKGISYMRLGDIYFNDRDYLKAQKYYDSTIQVLPEDYPTYDKIESKAEGLSDLVLHYETYVHEDSVQRVAKMPEKEREKFLRKTLKDIKEAEAKRKAEEERRLIAQQNRIQISGANTGSGSKWYFYNQKVSSSGFNDFRSLWGQRVLEDDWRRSTKNSYNTDQPEDGNLGDSTVVVVDSLTVDVLRANLPLTKSAMDSSINRLMNSLYMLGIIYKEQLKENDEAINYFSKIIDRDVQHPKVLPAYYQLYLLYKNKDASLANRYKEKILTDYPDSEIAEIIQDPDYLKKKQETEQEELREYGKTLEDYRYHRYSTVLTQCNLVIANDTTNEYLYKYYLLKAFSVAKLQSGNVNAVKEPLQELYSLAPQSDEGKEAKTYLDKLSRGLNIVNPNTTTKEDPSPFIYDKEMEHYFILVFPTSAGKINATQVKLSNFNTDFFKSARLKITVAQMGTENQLVVVQKFSNQEKAANYVTAFTSVSARPTLGKMAEEYDHFIINSANFTKFFESMNLAEYMDFYKDKYPQ